MAISVDKLRKQTESARKRQENRNINLKNKQDASLKRESKKIADEVIKTLEVKLGKSSKKGEDSCEVLSSSGMSDELFRKAAGFIMTHCWDNGLDVEIKNRGGRSDEGYNDDYVLVSWPKSR